MQDKTCAEINLHESKMPLVSLSQPSSLRVSRVWRLADVVQFSQLVPRCYATAELHQVLNVMKRGDDPSHSMNPCHLNSLLDRCARINIYPIHRPCSTTQLTGVNTRELTPPRNRCRPLPILPVPA